MSKNTEEKPFTLKFILILSQTYKDNYHEYS
jgi:hypothetical protein